MWICTAAGMDSTVDGDEWTKSGDHQGPGATAGAVSASIPPVSAGMEGVPETPRVLR